MASLIIELPNSEISTFSNWMVLLSVSCSTLLRLPTSIPIIQWFSGHRSMCSQHQQTLHYPWANTILALYFYSILHVDLSLQSFFTKQFSNHSETPSQQENLRSIHSTVSNIQGLFTNFRVAVGFQALNFMFERGRPFLTLKRALSISKGHLH